MVWEGIADVGISEDSDLLVYGCPRLITKLRNPGDCQLIDMNDLYSRKQHENPTMASLAQFPRETLIELCIMAGCDYLPSIKQIGLKSGLKHYSKHKTFAKVI